MPAPVPLTLREAYDRYKDGKGIGRSDMFGHMISAIEGLQADMAKLSPERTEQMESRLAQAEARYADLAAAFFAANAPLRQPDGIDYAEGVSAGGIGSAWNTAKAGDLVSVSIEGGLSPDAMIDGLEDMPHRQLLNLASFFHIIVDKRWSASTLRAKITEAAHNEADAVARQNADADKDAA